MEVHAVPWRFHGPPWDSRKFNGISTKFHGPSMEFHRLSMELHGVPWIIHGNPMEFHRIPWNSMDFHGIPWSSMGLFYAGHWVCYNVIDIKYPFPMVHACLLITDSLHDPVAWYVWNKPCWDASSMVGHQKQTSKLALVQPNIPFVFKVPLCNLRPSMANAVPSM